MRKLNKRIVLSILLVVALVGVGATVALSLAQSNNVTNTFKAADNNTKIIEEVVDTTKTVTIENETDTPAFVRVRFELSPSDAGKMQVQGTSEQSKWTNGKDGFWYYLGAVPKGKLSDTIKAEVTGIKDDIDTFDVIVYEESCVATSLEGMTDENKLEAIQKAFTAADGESDGNE